MKTLHAVVIIVLSGLVFITSAIGVWRTHRSRDLLAATEQLIRADAELKREDDRLARTNTELLSANEELNRLNEKLRGALERSVTELKRCHGSVR